MHEELTLVTFGMGLLNSKYKKSKNWHGRSSNLMYSLLEIAEKKLKNWATFVWDPKSWDMIDLNFTSCPSLYIYFICIDSDNWK